MARSTTLNLFATAKDWHSLLGKIEEAFTLEYTMGGEYAHIPIKYTTHLSIPDIGNAKSGSSGTNDFYLCIPKGSEVIPRPIESNHGTRHSVDQKGNPESISIVFGGRFHENIIVAGQIGTVSLSPWSMQLMSKFGRETKNQFSRIKSYYVGNEAEELLKKGWRLTANSKSPKEYDLSFDS